MPICPKCHKIIKYLRMVSSGTEECEMFFNKKYGYADWRGEDFKSDGIVVLFYCPKCDNELFFDDQEAEEFLKDLKEKDELKELIIEKLEKKRKGGRK